MAARHSSARGPISSSTWFMSPEEVRRLSKAQELPLAHLQYYSYQRRRLELRARVAYHLVVHSDPALLDQPAGLAIGGD